ncbi:hypothetical protein [Paractinoplanes hotanensis]|uniref:Uncharacterized protein n=1 Tax=Paractinoplanes hotanensis TaxID=2906497 RepID=A0ABT0YBY1_9ACTN|nr:hypothetical protein [Actinoplanes hotanensis]MCM4083566.1 hypothetical protein [Actinoplanes hotanensis]
MLLRDPAAESWLFEASRLRLAFAEDLRRRKNLSAARAHLIVPGDGFAAMGAEPWPARTLTELRATGYRPALAVRPTPDLTSQETRDREPGGRRSDQQADR